MAKFGDYTEETSPAGDDLVLIKDVSGGDTNKVQVQNLLAQAGRKNILADGTVKGDGVTDDSSALAALLVGGSWYIPAGVYILASPVVVALTTGLDVVCAEGVEFRATSAVDGDLFDWDTNTFTIQVRFSWRGGIINTGAAKNATVTSSERIGLRDEGTEATADSFSFRDGTFGEIILDSMLFTARSGASSLPSSISSYTDPTKQHWMGDPTTAANNGGDSHVFANCGGGPIIIRNCVFLGSVDSAIYIAGASGATKPVNTTIEGCSFFWCATGVSIKSDTERAVIANCVTYGCAVGYEAIGTATYTGPTNTTFTGCTAELYNKAFVVDESYTTRLVGCRAINGGYLDWHGEATHAYGIATLTGGASGSVDSITVNGVTITSGAESFDTDLETTAKNVAANINAHTSVPNFVAHVREDPGTAGDWQIIINNASSGTDSNADVVVCNTTTITSSVDNMVYAFAQPKAVEVIGSADTFIDGIEIVGTDATWDANRTPNVEAFVIKGLAQADTSAEINADTDTTDTTIVNARVDGADSLGGEQTVTGPGDPIRTRVSGLICGNALDDYTGFVKLGTTTHVDYGDVQSYTLSADQTWTSDTVFSNMTEDGDSGGRALTFSLKSGAQYLLTGYYIFSGDETGDLKFDWSGANAADAGYWNCTGPNRNITGSTYDGKTLGMDAFDWTTAVNGIGGLTGAPVLVGQFQGVIICAADRTMTLQATQGASSTTATTLYAGTTVQFERIG